MGSTPSNRIKIDLKDLVIKPLNSEMGRAAFSCGNEELTGYFRDFADEHHNKGWVRVYVGLHKDEIVAYYWLSAQGVDPTKLNEKTAEHMGRIEFASCIYLGMLATQTEYHGNGIGPIMMLHAFGQAVEVAKLVGVYAITLQAVDKRTADKYADDFDFCPFEDGTEITEDSENIWMFLPLETARQAIELWREAREKRSRIDTSGKSPS
jgi:GNAT superfamily N-acetyltransferase